jgi:membrane protein required for colicin V production
MLSLVTHAVSRTIQKSALNNLDRSLGFLFGLVRAVIVLGVGLIVVDWLTDSAHRPEWVRTAKTLPIIERSADTIKTLVPSTFMAPSAIAKEPALNVKTAADAKKALDHLTKPAASAPAAKEREGYDDKARNDLERLFDATASQPVAASPEKPND